MSAAVAPEQSRFLEFLSAIEFRTEDELVADVAACPAEIRERLERGPLDRRYACGVCAAFGRGFYGKPPDPTDPMWRVWGYHEVPKLRITRREQNYYGALANEIYERTLATYCAAGWRGEATPADA